MRFLLKVRVNLETMRAFGAALQKGELDRSCVRGETVCLKDDPAVGYSVWETVSREEFDLKFDPWRAYYDAVEVREAISPNEAMTMLYRKKR
jgi:hypothetical protein